MEEVNFLGRNFAGLDKIVFLNLKSLSLFSVKLT